MIHNPISIHSLGLYFPHKTCFSEFSAEIHYGQRIAIIGRNGSGKSSLLKIIQGIQEPSEGNIHIPKDVGFGYLPQLINEFNDKSGAEKFNKALSHVLSQNPDILLLDEPTNHLDISNRKSLLGMINRFPGTLTIVSHDVELLKGCIDILWHIEDGKIHAFKGNYDDYMREINAKRARTLHELSHLEAEKKEMHLALMKEQKRAKNSKKQGANHIEQRKWPTIVSNAKANRASETAGKKKRQINDKKQELIDSLSELRLPEVIKPNFTLAAVSTNKTHISIIEGSFGYHKPIVTNINLNIAENDRIAIVGDNGSGKSTLIKAILNEPSVKKLGDWYLPSVNDIGYLDQHYNNIDSNSSILEEMSSLVPSWSHAEIRKHLNDFLFRKNEEVNMLTSNLSGGEKVRFSLAKIAAKTPKLLILDEITNNLDIETREHIIQVLQQYPGAMIVISHDNDFLKQIGINNYYGIKEGRLI
jgi:ATPase subunit of ABC transporter with duplicated ATPase domains